MAVMGRSGNGSHHSSTQSLSVLGISVASPSTTHSSHPQQQATHSAQQDHQNPAKIPIFSLSYRFSTINMHFPTIISILASVAVAAALPASGSGSLATQQDLQCGVGNAASCCNSDDAVSGISLVNTVLGGSCSILVPVLSGAVGASCNAANTFCCPMNQDVSISLRS